MSLYDVTESAPVNTVPKYRRNGARYGQAVCVGGCVDRWSSSVLFLNLYIWEKKGSWIVYSIDNFGMKIDNDLQKGITWTVPVTEWKWVNGVM